MEKLNKILYYLKNSEKVNSRVESQITIFVVIISSILGLAYWLSRYGLSDNSPFIILRVLSISYILLILPYLIRSKIRMKNHWFNSASALSIFTAFLLVLAGFISTVININLFVNCLIPFGFILLILFLLDYFLYSFKKVDIFYIVLFIFFSLFVVAAVWGTKVLSPLFLEKIILGSAHIDTLYHSAISNLIKTYNIPSIGADGLSYLPYHWGSHLVFAFFSALAKVNSVVFYNLGFPVIFIPFYFKSILLFVVEARKYKKFLLQFDLVFYIVLFTAYVGIVPIGWKEISVPLLPPFSSESHLLGMSFVFLLFGTTLAFIKKIKQGIDVNYSKSDYLFIFLFLPFLFAVIGLLKNSALFFLSALYGFLFLRMKWYRDTKLWLSTIIYVLISIIIAKITLRGDGGNIEFCAFLKGVEHEWYGIFFLFYSIWLLIFILLFFYRHKISDDLKTFFTKGRAWELEILLLLCLLGFLPGIIFNIPGGNAIYFLDFQRWISFGFVLVYLPVFFDNKRDFFIFLRGKLNIYIFVSVLFFGSIFTYNFLHNYLRQAKLFMGRNIASRGAVLDSNENNLIIAETLTKPFLGKEGVSFILSLYNQPYQDVLEKNKRYQLLKIFKEIERLPIAEKKETCIYIPKSNNLFWGSWETPYSKKDDSKMYLKIPLLVPALSGVAMIGGFPQELPGGAPIEWYGYGGYDQEAVYTANDLTVEEIKLLAEKRGFKRIIIIRLSKDELVVEKI